MQRLATIGVYGASLDSFLATLRAADVALVLDVRQRRGVRGREYAWANAQRLQAALRVPGITYALLSVVERDPEACHRSLAAAAIAAEAGVGVVDLRPPLG